MLTPRALQRNTKPGTGHVEDHFLDHLADQHLALGDGTFGPPASYAVGRDALAIAAGDFNFGGFPSRNLI
jgi:hypothetical protein